MRTRFAQHDWAAVATCLSAEKSFLTSGNLWGDEWGTTAQSPGAWERHHPQWFQYLEGIRGREKVDYIVYSYNTMIGVKLGSGRWVVDAAANHHSPMTAQAVGSFRTALRQVAQSDQVEEIGREWMVSRNLTHAQRAVMYNNLGIASRKPTHDALVRNGLIEPNGVLTELGHGVRQWCNWWL